jgi:hypothetical protein
VVERSLLREADDRAFRGTVGGFLGQVDDSPEDAMLTLLPRGELEARSPVLDSRAQSKPGW